MAGADGVASPASGLRLRPRDLARIGQLVLARGQWAGREIVPAAWLAAALRPQVRIAEDFDYGYQWYLGTLNAPGGGPVRWVGGMGNGGQRLFVIAALDLVVAITAGNYDGDDQSTTPTAVLDEVVGASVAG
jgi:CubicO group peptidase (beta-lactamase class C family)